MTDETPQPPLPAALIESVADRFRLLGDPTRLRLVNQLHAVGEMSVGDLVERVGVSYATASKQLALLRAHRMVSRRREGTKVFYSICDPSLNEVCDAVCRSLREHWQIWGAGLEESFAED